jgi:YHS domain-containing protein
MKTWKNVALASAVVVVALSFSNAAVADCKKKSKAKRTDEKAQMQGMEMGEDMAHGCMMDMGDMEMEGHSDMSDPASAESAGSQKVVDPVCGMTVGAETAEKSMYEGKGYYFCSKEDRDLFEKSPEKYLKGKAPSVK